MNPIGKNKHTDADRKIKTKKLNIRWMLLAFDIIVFAACFAVIYFTGERGAFPYWSGVCVIVSVVIFRFIFNIYRQVWRYGGVPSYIKLMLADLFACIAAIPANLLMPAPKMNTAGVITLIRKMYRFRRADSKDRDNRRRKGRNRACRGACSRRKRALQAHLFRGRQE